MLCFSWNHDSTWIFSIVEPADEHMGEGEETGCDVFDHIPSDEAASAGDLQLELSDRPHLSTYNLTFSRNEG